MQTNRHVLTNFIDKSRLAPALGKGSDYQLSASLEKMGQLDAELRNRTRCCMRCRIMPSKITDSTLEK